MQRRLQIPIARDDAIALDGYSTAWQFDGWDVEIIPPKNAEH